MRRATARIRDHHEPLPAARYSTSIRPVSGSPSVAPAPGSARFSLLAETALSLAGAWAPRIITGSLLGPIAKQRFTFETSCESGVTGTVTDCPVHAAL